MLHERRPLLYCDEGLLFGWARAKMIASSAPRSRNVIAVRFFLARATRGDFGASWSALDSIIFFLTSFCVDSIHSISCNIRPLQDSMKNGKGE